MPLSTREAPVTRREIPQPPRTPSTLTEDAAATDPGQSAIEEAIRVIQRHVDKEARNRWVEHLEVRDLCARQKADLVADLAKLF
jgi:hypothetical protein